MHDKRKAFKMERYLIENNGPNEANVKFMFRESLRICQCDGIAKITLCVPSKREFPTTVVGKVLGGLARKLCQGQIVRLQENLSLELVCASKIHPFSVYEMVIAA